MFDGLPADPETMLQIQARYCVECGKPLEELPISAPHKKFCSMECRNAYHYKRNVKPARLRRAAAKAAARAARLAENLDRFEYVKPKEQDVSNDTNTK